MSTCMSATGRPPRACYGFALLAHGRSECASGAKHMNTCARKRPQSSGLVSAFLASRVFVLLLLLLLLLLLQLSRVSKAVGFEIGVPSDMEAVDWAAALEQVWSKIMRYICLCVCLDFRPKDPDL